MAPLTARQVWRKYVTDGVPDSGIWDPKKEEIIQLLEMLFGTSRGGWVVARTRAELLAVTPENETDGGVVLYDSNPAYNGYYQRDAGAWVRERGFPDTFARVDLSGTGNVQSGVVGSGVNPADIEIFFAVVTSENTGPMTLTVTGGPARDVVNAAGNPLSAGEWTGVVMFFLNDDMDYQLINDAGAAAAAAQSATDAEAAEVGAEAARDAAEGAANTVTVGRYNSIAGVQAATINVATLSLIVTGYSAAGDTGVAFNLARVNSEPSHPGKVRSTDRFKADGTTSSDDGGWWVYTDATVNQMMFGAVKGTGSDSTTALKNMIAYQAATGAVCKCIKASHLVTSTIETGTTNGDWGEVSLYASGVTFQAADDKTVFRIGKVSGQASRRNIVAPYVENLDHTTGDEWADFLDTIGIELANLNHSAVDYLHSWGWGVGVRVGGYSTGSAYNICTIKTIYGNKTNLQFCQGNTTGWANQNTFIGGQLALSAGEPNTGTTLVEFTRLSGSSWSPPNNNTLLGVSFEGVEPGFVVKMLGRQNRFYNCRYEVPNPRIQLISSLTRANKWDGGWGLDSVTWSHDTTDGTPLTNEVNGAEFNSFYGYDHTLRLGIYQGSAAHMIGWGQSIDPLLKNASSTDWLFRLGRLNFEFKAASDVAARTSISVTAGLIYFGDGTATPTKYIGDVSGGGIMVNAHLRAAATNTHNLGTPSVLWGTVYAATGTINTSDERDKDWRGALNEAEIAVGQRLSKLIGIYRWKSAIEAKGDAARLHAGVTVQAVIAAFNAENIEAFDYGMVCFDEWEGEAGRTDEDGVEIVPSIQAGNRYGLRYDELWAFVAAGFEARLSALEASV